MTFKSEEFNYYVIGENISKFISKLHIHTS